MMLTAASCAPKWTISSWGTIFSTKKSSPTGIRPTTGKKNSNSTKSADYFSSNILFLNSGSGRTTEMVIEARFSPTDSAIFL